MSPTPVNPFADVQVLASGAEPIPVGSYFTVFRGVEVFSNSKVEGKLRFAWEIVTGPMKGKTATALTDMKLTPITHAGRLISGLVGRPLQPGEDASALWTAVQSAIGKKFLVSVQPGPKGGKQSVQVVSTPPEE